MIDAATVRAKMPAPRKGSNSPRLGEAEFRRRFLSQFQDGAYAPLLVEGWMPEQVRHDGLHYRPIKSFWSRGQSPRFQCSGSSRLMIASSRSELPIVTSSGRVTARS